jgi:hypothetical protein
MGIMRFGALTLTLSHGGEGIKAGELMPAEMVHNLGN